jgi:hypothetical protein
MALLTDFTAPTTDLKSYAWGDEKGFHGGTYVYPAAGDMGATHPLTTSFANGEWSIGGKVGTYSGFGLWVDCVVDASAYKGIRFDISGNVGPGGEVTFNVPTASNTWKNPTKMPPGHESCEATETTQYSLCLAASKKIKVTTAVQTITVEWTDLTGGLPKAFDPKEIMGFQWQLAWPPPAQGGAGGAGGGSSGGGTAGAPMAGMSGATAGGNAGAGGATAGAGGATAGAGGVAGSSGASGGGAAGSAGAAGNAGTSGGGPGGAAGAAGSGGGASGSAGAAGTAAGAAGKGGGP